MDVGQGFARFIQAVLRMYFNLTQHLPRLVPRTKQDFLTLEHRLTEYLGVPKDLKTTITLTASVQGTTTKRRSLASYKLHLDRYYGNAEIEEVKRAATQAWNEHLAEKLKQAEEDFRKEERAVQDAQPAQPQV